MPIETVEGSVVPDCCIESENTTNHDEGGRGRNVLRAIGIGLRTPWGGGLLSVVGRGLATVMETSQPEILMLKKVSRVRLWKVQPTIHALKGDVQTNDELGGCNRSEY